MPGKKNGTTLKSMILYDPTMCSTVFQVRVFPKVMLTLPRRFWERGAPLIMHFTEHGQFPTALEAIEDIRRLPGAQTLNGLVSCTQGSMKGNTTSA